MKTIPSIALADGRRIRSRIDCGAAISLAELFTIGIGPSSSHTVGPMRAAHAFMLEIADHRSAPAHICVELFGSLALTGHGHATDKAILLGLSGELPETVDAAAATGIVSSASEMLHTGEETGLSIAAIVATNETAWRPARDTNALLDRIAKTMDDCIERGMREEGLLPGGLKVRRRAKSIYARLRAQPAEQRFAKVFEWVSLFALAVNEENAAGGRVVTAPTNGAAGVIPAVIRYYRTFIPGADGEGVRTFLLTAAAIGFLYKKRASISAAEMGCQGEVGVACSMAAAGLAAVLGGTNSQIENAAEIGMEHNLGLTCDPVGGLVQIPCIERNTMGAVKAINAAYLALQGDGRHVVSLDAVIETMRQTGEDMQSRYKETSLGGLAVNVVEC